MANEILSIDIFDKHYELPKDIITYTDEHHSFEVYRQELLSYFTENFYDYQHLPSEAEKKAYDKFRHYGNLCVQKLIENEIYNITADELVGGLPEKYTWKFCSDSSNNDGVKLFYKTFCDAITEQANALLEQMSSFVSQAQQAEQAKDSKITGTGFGIITNDIIGYGVWAAMENKAIKQQSSVANAEFQNEIDTIQKKLEQTSKGRLSQFGTEVWLPSLKNSVDLFVISLFNKYVDVLISNGKFNADALNHIDITKSQSILQNIDSTNNKIGILDAAFLSCPFNPNLYDIAIKYCDITNVINCAKIFSLDDILLSNYSQICSKIASDRNLNDDDVVDRISPYISILSILSGQSDKAIKDEYVETHRAVMRKRIKKTLLIWDTASNYDLKSMIISITGKSIVDLYDIGNSELKDIITKKIILESFGEKKPSSYYDEIILQTSDKIVSITKEYIDKCVSANQDYLFKKTQYDECKKQLDKELNKINEDLDSLGIFSFSKKKELNNKIVEIKQHIKDKREIYVLAEIKYNSLI